MARRTMMAIAPLHPQPVPEQGWKMAGTTVHGRQLYIERLERSRGVPLLDDNGERVWSKNPLSGEPLIPKNKMQRYTEERLFFLQSQGNGQIEKVRYRPPTPEEIAEQERAGKIKQFQDQMAAAFVDSGIPLDHLLGLLKQGKAVTPQEVADEPNESDDADPPGANYPQKVQRGHYRLSTGEVFRGAKADAEAAQEAINEAEEEDENFEIPEPGSEL